MAILSIQSHVVFGYAGNTAAVFPMQRLGHEVWALNTVEFSNHTGYGAWRGKVLGAELVRELVTGLDERGVLSRCDAVISGYLGDARTGQAIAASVKMARSKNVNALYCCDPVMGDTGTGIYVTSDIPEIFKTELCPLADIVTPNQFELEILSGKKPDTLDNARRAMDIVHAAGPRVVLVTSFFDNQKQREPKTRAQIGMLVSGPSGVFRISTPELPLETNAAGCGDLTTSVFLSRFLETGDPKRALELCAASVYGILKKSFLADNRRVKKEPLELLIVQAQDELANPTEVFEAEKI